MLFIYNLYSPLFASVSVDNEKLKTLYNIEFSDPLKAKLKSKQLFIAVHPSYEFDETGSIKDTANLLVDIAKINNVSIFYLQNNLNNELNYCTVKEADYIFFSDAGEFSFDVEPEKIFIIGGKLSHCLARTVKQLLQNWHYKRKSLIIYFIIPAIYDHSDSRLVGELAHMVTDKGLINKFGHGIPIFEFLNLHSTEHDKFVNLKQVVLKYFIKDMPHHNIILRFKSTTEKLYLAKDDLYGTIELKFIDYTEYINIIYH